MKLITDPVFDRKASNQQAGEREYYRRQVEILISCRHKKTPSRNTGRSLNFPLQLGPAMIEPSRSYNRKRLPASGVSGRVLLVQQHGPLAFWLLTDQPNHSHQVPPKSRFEGSAFEALNS